MLDSTLILVLSDNGASAEGGVAGTSNEHRFTHRLRDELADNLARLDDWGGTGGYPHYPWGWAWAGNTPFRLWKRYTWLGGTRVPLIAHWPGGAGPAGGIRGQFGHAIDVLPTVLEACGVELPGAGRHAVDGASTAATFSDPDAPDPRSTQYFELLGSRSIVADGWKATTDHVSSGVADEEELMTGSRDFAADRWSLFRLDEDFSECHDVAAAHPDVVRRLEQQWFAEAGRNQVLPLSDSLIQRLGTLVPADYPPGSSVVLYPQGGPVSDDALPMLARGGLIVAEVDVPDEDANGVLFALGDRTGGLAAYVVEGTLHVAVVAPGGPIRVTAERKIPPGRHDAGCVLRPEPGGGVRVDAIIDGALAGTARAGHSLPVVWQHGGTSLTLGRDRGLPVCDGYRPPFPWTGTLRHVRIDAGRQQPADPDTATVALQAD